MDVKAKSAEAQLRKGIIAALRAKSLPVSKDVRVFPRIELTEVTESGSIDKDEDVRELGFVVEAISLNAYEEAAGISDDCSFPPIAAGATLFVRHCCATAASCGFCTASQIWIQSSSSNSKRSPKAAVWIGSCASILWSRESRRGSFFPPKASPFIGTTGV